MTAVLASRVLFRTAANARGTTRNPVVVIIYSRHEGYVFHPTQSLTMLIRHYDPFQRASV